jgi:hypothetical protein
VISTVSGKPLPPSLRLMPTLLTAISMLCALLVSCSSAGGSAATKVEVASPTADAVTVSYVALVHDYWIGEQAADEVSSGSNVAARVCLGMKPPGAPSQLQLIDPSMCKERAVAILANQQKFLSDLDRTPPPPKFAADDQVFRMQISKAIADLQALISATQTGSKQAVLDTATAYNDDMFPTVTDALNDVDPLVPHP